MEFVRTNLLLLLLCGAVPPLAADDVCGPGRTTLRRTWWGGIFYEPAALGPHRLTDQPNDVRLVTVEGEVAVLGSELDGFRLVRGREQLTVRATPNNVEVRWGDRVWSARVQPGRLDLRSAEPADTLEFTRNANSFTIRGARGVVTGTDNFGTLTLRSPAGTSVVRRHLGLLEVQGALLGQVPYLGSGLTLRFHGVGLFLDLRRLFPLPELDAWWEWKPLLLPVGRGGS